MKKNSFGIVGYGNMGAAIGQLVKNDYSVFVFDVDPKKTREASGATVVASLSDLFTSTTAVLIAVKPQDMRSLLEQIKPFATPKHLLISIAAGVQTRDIEAILAPLAVKVVRVMPNLLIRIGKGTSCVCTGKAASAIELAFTEGIFSRLGKVRRIPENMMDAATALFGSAPGYLSYLLETKNIDIKKEFVPAFAGVVRDKLQFTAVDAQQLAITTGNATLEIIRQLGSAETLRKQVTSKGGTTEAAIKALEEGKSLREAINAAIQRAKELTELVRGTMQENKP